MAQCTETILKMEQWSTNSTVIKGSVSMVLLSFIVTKDSGMALHHAVSQMVSISALRLSGCEHFPGPLEKNGPWGCIFFIKTMRLTFSITSEMSHHTCYPLILRKGQWGQDRTRFASGAVYETI